jgi:glycosyltransferase involved in cell wall biosynthesis
MTTDATAAPGAGSARTASALADAARDAPRAVPGGPERLAVFLPSLAGGGAERAMLNVARGFRDLGHRVDLVLAAASGPYLAEVPGGVRVVDLGAGRVLAALPGLARYLRRERPDRLYAAMDHANLVALWARRLARAPTRVVLGVRDTWGPVAPGERNLRRAVVGPLARLAYPGADGVLAVSDGVADSLAAALGLERSRIAVVPTPVVTPELEALAAAPVGHPWFAPGAPPVVLGCGRLVAQKDFPTLLRAFALLRQRRPARLVILGEGPDREPLRAHAAALGVAADLDLPGFEPNPFRFMARAAAFALSSMREGSPNVLVQALACGCPVVSTDCPSGPREILAGLGQGRLVPVGDHAAMAAALDALLDGPRLPPPPLERFGYLGAARHYLTVGAR